MNRKIVLVCAAFAALAVNVYAVETRFWEQNDPTEFEKGSFENVSLRSDGRMFLAPSAREIFDSSVPYLWSIASDSKGNVYAAGGGTGNGRTKLFQISPAGKSRTVLDMEGLEIHAIAVDKNDQVFVATDPDGKVYKISATGTSQLFYDPRAKYIWAMAFDKAGNLFVATGDQGEIHRVTPDGQGAVFFRTEETHARSLTIDRDGNLIVGTEPGGLILRISPAATGFVLYQAPKREITAVAVAANGAIYAAGVGTRPAAPVPSPAAPVPVPSPPPPTTSTTVVVPAQGRTPAHANPPPSFTPTSVSGGSDVYRIDPDGSPHKVWSNTQDIVYAVGFDAAGLPLLGTGNRGRVYRLDSDILSTQLVNLAPTQVTSFARTPQGDIYAITGNIGKIYRIGPGYAKNGTFESEALDAGSFAYWGRLTLRGSQSGLAVRTRSGNLNRPVNNWSAWMPMPLQVDGEDSSGRVASPAARFLQYQVAFTDSGSKPPEISTVDIAYLTKNVAPVVQQIEITPANYKFPNQSLTLTPSTNITLPALGQKRAAQAVSAIDLGSAQTMNYSKGFIGARWLAHDENGDTMAYKIELRGRGESEWKLLKDKLKEKEYSWDSTAFPDGEYEIRVTATDSPSNPPGDALTASLTSDPFLIDNTPPDISGLTAAANGPRIDVRWSARDGRSIIDHAEYSVNGGEWIVVEPVNHLSDAPSEEYRISVERSSPGEQTIAVRVTDSYDNQTVAKTTVK